MQIKEYWTGLRSHKRAALAIAVIVALADTVIVYDLWLAGSWLTLPGLSVAKTAAFVILFIGSLVAEMQELQKRTRFLLFAGVVILGAYQAAINIVANYHGANIPPETVALFEPHLNAMQVRVWYAIVDGLVRTTVVIIMWLVTGLVWRGLATSEQVSSEQLAEVNAENTELLTQVSELSSQLKQTEQRARQAEQRFEAIGDLAILLTSEDKRERILAAYKWQPELPQRSIALIAGASPAHVSNVLSENGKQE